MIGADSFLKDEFPPQLRSGVGAFVPEQELHDS